MKDQLTLFYARLKERGLVVNDDDISSIIDEFIEDNKPEEITIEDVVKTVCDVLGVSKSEIGVKTRERRIVEARQLAMYFSKAFTDLSLAAIGTEIGNKDHATVLHACKTVRNLKETDRTFRSKYESIIERLKEFESA